MGNFNSYNQQKMSELKEQVAIAEAEAAKYFEGNDAAEEKLDKALEQIQTTAQLLRNGMSEKKNAK